MAKRIIPLQIYQDAMSKALEKISQTDNIEEVFHDVLSDVKDYYKAGRVAIMATVPGHPDLQLSVFELNAHGVSSTKERTNGYFPKHRWWYDRLERGESVVVNDVTMLPKGEGSPRELFDKLGVRAHIGVPINRYTLESSFLCIDIIDHPFEWTSQDERLLRDIANMIMMWRRLQNAKQEAEQKQDYLHRVLDNIPVGLALYDENGLMTYANSKTLEAFDVKKSQILHHFNLFNSHNLSSDDIVEIKRRNSYDSAFEYMLGSNPNKQRPAMGKPIYVLARYSKLFDENGTLNAYLAAYMDRTDETNIGNRVKELDGFVSVCADYARIGFARVNVATGKGYGTRQWFRNFNIPVVEGEQDYSETLMRLHPDDRQKVYDYRQRALTNPNAKFRERMRVMKDNGEAGFNYVKVYSVVTRFDPEHGDVETSTISHSINRQVAMEQSLIQAKDDAEKADRLKSAFLANMSHEIRTPLNAIVGFSQLLCHDEIPPEERQGVMNIIETNNALLLQLINDILDLAKLETGTQEFVIRDTDINEICQSALTSISMRTKPGVELLLDCPLDHCHLQTDPNRLKQVLLNFASNAAKFTAAGHVKMGYQLIDGHRLRLYTEDTGIGIAQEKLAHVFERFVKLNDFEQGTGLGLQISKEIITHLGGTIGVDSTLGKGSTFWCELPI